MARQEVKSLVERLHEIWNKHDLAAIPDVYTEDFVVHWPKSYPRTELHGHQGVKTAIEEILVAFPDWQEEVVDLIVDGDRAVTRYISTGTHKGPLAELAPTGRRISVDEISIFRVTDGRIAEQWCLVDDVTLLRQLGQEI